ncbi:hypothetical protein HY989_00450 [Candidatus Micrarchaeota archaeon]|nr:hypothetical protein [Candidatus Micrarchaeota archaeon]
MDKNVIDWFGTYQGTATILSIPLNIVYMIYWVYLLSRNPFMFLGSSGQTPLDNNLFLVIFGLVFAAYFIGLMCVWLNLFYIIGNTTRNQKEETIKLSYLD